jgi:hypothetical protein
MTTYFPLSPLCLIGAQARDLARPGFAAGLPLSLFRLCCSPQVGDQCCCHNAPGPRPPPRPVGRPSRALATGACPCWVDLSILWACRGAVFAASDQPDDQVITPSCPPHLVLNTSPSQSPSSQPRTPLPSCPLAFSPRGDVVLSDGALRAISKLKKVAVLTLWLMVRSLTCSNAPYSQRRELHA